ncbi:autotransporter assembly complex family protein [Nitrosomonas sp. Nm132]|uniref:autotransporter assembly complex protein TamA n=1 Tax=Nitrosomonas sp. Nm132 TaxID=1881053 RepID=UPI00087E5B6A|nr:autotransporter assembly complex family protein [Nitrosomonas sp. Nm132]SDH34554.1 translocation and assembly module TamA [Nitrosomonas sp. Nm132]
MAIDYPTQSPVSFPISFYGVCWLFITLFAVLCLCALSPVVIAAQANQNSNSESESAAVVELSAPKSVKKLIKKHIPLPEEPFAHDIAQAAFVRKIRQEIKELLATEGYFTATVTLEDHLTGEKPTLKVVPGPRTRVTEVTIEFQGDLAVETPEHHQRIEQLRASWLLTPRKFFRSSAWEEAKAALLSSVAEREYAATQIVSSQAEVDPAAANAKLRIVIDSGPVFYFGDLQITGLERYDQSLISNYASFQKGDPYHRDKLLAFQAALQNIPHLSSASVSIRPDIAYHQAIPVEVILTEAHSRRIAIGAGYSTNTGARGEINYRNYNFLNRALNMSSLLRYEQKRQIFSAKIDTVPDENNYLYSLGARVERTDIEDLRTFNQKVSLTRDRTMEKMRTQLGIAWQREERQPVGAPDTTAHALALDTWWRYHNVDNPLHARRGHITEMRIGGGSQYLLSKRDFVRTYARHQHWWPIGARDVLFLRAEVGYTLASSRDGIPQEYLFRAGGIQSVRGYDFLSLGVREGDAIVGGRTLGTGTLEYVRWFTENWGTALFADVGDAADSWRSFNPSLGYGSGIRWRSPAGPLALDLARRHDTGTLRVHFSIAVAF